MEKSVTAGKFFKTGKIFTVLYITSVLMLCSCSETIASHQLSGVQPPIKKDTSVAYYIHRYLSETKDRPALHFPNSVRRFYSLNDDQAAWVKEKSDPKQTWQAMLLLDCVLQYGLFHEDYHPKELLYEPLHTMLEETGKIGNREKARFDLLLTDAMVTLMNNLHYGKLNPLFIPAKIDSGLDIPFHADEALIEARKQPDFTRAIESAQPKSKLYLHMQDYMRKLKGVYVEDCYEIPESVIRKVAINMERLRWAEVDEDTYIQINIPSFTLRFIQPDSIYMFNVIVGKPSAPTPLLNSDITYLTTMPGSKIPQTKFIKEILPKTLKDPLYPDKNHYTIYEKNGGPVKISKQSLLKIKHHPQEYYVKQYFGSDQDPGQLVFRFANLYNIYLHDTNDQRSFTKEDRAECNYSVRVERAKELALLLLKSGGTPAKIAELNDALKRHLTKNISLKKAIPIKIVYLTCVVTKGLVVDYKDVYNFDKALESALYHSNVILSMK